MKEKHYKKKKKWVRVVFRRRVFVIFLLLVQIMFIIFITMGSDLLSRYLGLTFHLLSLSVCLYIVNKKEKPAYKVTWVFLILAFPVFGGILYIIFHTQFNSKRMTNLIIQNQEESKPFYLLCGDTFSTLAEAGYDCLSQIRYLQHYAGFPIYDHTQTVYFDSGERYFVQVLKELETAERYIFLEFFIMRQGVMLDPIIDILEKKAKAGLDVRIMYDDLGCFLSLPPDYKRRLEEKGIKCIVFSPFTPILSSHQNNRDHRKIIAIDGRAAFTGGINLADEYINEFERFGHWKDSGIMLHGKAAWSLAMIFLEMWNFELMRINPRLPKDNYTAFYPWKDEPCAVESDGYVQPYADSPIDDENVGEHVYIQIINNAKEYVYINTPYLVVDDNLLSALSLAAKSGIDVRIITPHRWDKKIVAIASRSYYRQLIQAGVKVYEYTNGFNHSKTFVSDDKIATVGTTNLDFRSLYLHFECGVCIYQNSGIAAIKKDFLDTQRISHLITLKDCARNAFQRVVQDILRIFAPLM
ncbi:MAG: cardiolipin synthase [Treponema sp.]|jgi:cardiolipin synthase|nr:cardiolipin synthase [Treponema sp.]